MKMRIETCGYNGYWLIMVWMVWVVLGMFTVWRGLMDEIVEVS